MEDLLEMKATDTGKQIDELETHKGKLPSTN